MSERNLGNTSVEDVKATTSDVVIVGNGNMFQLLCKASSKSQGWMKSTKACEVDGGCIVQSTSEFRDSNNEYIGGTDSLVFVPNVKIVSDVNGGRKLVPVSGDVSNELR